MATYEAYEQSVTPKPETPFRVPFGWSNYKDFATLEEALQFIIEWERPRTWKDDLYNDPNRVLDTTRRDGLGWATVVTEEVGRAMRDAHLAAMEGTN